MRLVSIFLASTISIAICWTFVVLGKIIFKEYLIYFSDEPLFSTIVVFILVALIQFIPTGVKIIRTRREKSRSL